MHLLLVFLFLMSMSFSQVTFTLIPTTGIPPPGRYDNIFIYSDALNSIIIFGGTNNQNYFNDLWLLNLDYFQWSKQYVSSGVRPCNL